MNTAKFVDDDGTVYLKVIDFPVPKGVGCAGESMWVRQVTGDDNAGTGTLDNLPAFCQVVTHGDLIEFGGGDDDTKPQFIRRIEEEGK